MTSCDLCGVLFQRWLRVHVLVEWRHDRYVFCSRACALHSLLGSLTRDVADRSIGPLVRKEG